jgi:tetratricopeptide (TPR) repeat protein
LERSSGAVAMAGTIAADLAVLCESSSYDQVQLPRGWTERPSREKLYIDEGQARASFWHPQEILHMKLESLQASEETLARVILICDMLPVSAHQFTTLVLNVFVTMETYGGVRCDALLAKEQLKRLNVLLKLREACEEQGDSSAAAKYEKQAMELTLHHERAGDVCMERQDYMGAGRAFSITFLLYLSMGPEFHAECAKFLHCLTLVFTMLEKWQAGFEIAHLALYVMTLVPMNEDSRDWAVMLSTMGVFYRILEFPNAALVHHLRAYVCVERSLQPQASPGEAAGEGTAIGRREIFLMNTSQWLASERQNIALCFLALGDVERAVSYLKGAYDSWKLVEDRNMAREAFIMITLKLTECGKVEQAIVCIQAAYDISSHACSLGEKLEDVTRLAGYYALVGRDAEAIECFGMYFAVRVNERRALVSPLLDERHEAHYYLTYANCLIADRKYSLAMDALRKSKSLDMSETHRAYWCIIMASWHIGNRNLQDARAYIAKAYAHELTDDEVIQKRYQVQQILDKFAVQREKEAAEAGESLMNQIAVEAGGGTGVKGCKKNSRKNRSGDAKASIAAPEVKSEMDVKEPTEWGLLAKMQDMQFAPKDSTKIVDCSFQPDVAPSECCVCLDEAKTHAFVPCGHLCVCAGCAESIMSSLKKECPSCRGPAAHVVKIFQ